MSSNPLYNAQPRLHPGDQLREYRIISLVGVGGMGAVYEAEHEVLGARVAVKEILFHPHELDTNAYHRLEEAFLKEARLLIRLDHRQLPPQGALVPRANNLFREGEYWYLVMEYMPGDTLGDRLEKNNRRPLPVEQVQTWLIQLLTTLDYLHHQEPPLIHRDIKPSNLKVNEMGRLVLLDFGIAKGGIGGSSVTSMFSPSVQFYTPHYSPPEQIRGKGTDARTDLFAVAATMYYLLAGSSPPTAETRSYAVIDAEPDPLPLLNTVNPNVPESFAWILNAALSLKMEDRPASAAEMRAMLLGEIPAPAPVPMVIAKAPSGPLPPVAADVSSTDPIVTPISRPNPISRPTPEAEIESETEAALPANDLWGAPVSVFEEGAQKGKRSFPVAPLLVGVVALLLILLVGYQVIQAGNSGNSPALTGGDALTATSNAAIALLTTPSPESTSPVAADGNVPTNPTNEGSGAAPTAVESSNGAPVATSTRLATSTPLQIATATALPTETAAPTATTGATATPRPTTPAAPTATRSPVAPPTATRVQLATVALSSPADGESFSQGSAISLAWQGQSLAANESYFVRIWKQSVPGTPEREFTTRTTNATFSDLNPEAYIWSVQIMGANGLVSGTASETRSFFISGGGDGPPDDGTPATPAPNPTAPPPQ